uniref:Meckelin n=1 Tax=Globisporangium ultimum (strain ATCC 200006 / CBS 805.95 / DAOM BR144) TaxID=431595 RepID=K3WK50_GLOUD
MCTNGTKVSDDKASCVACPDPAMTLAVAGGTATCECANGYQQITSTRLNQTKCFKQSHANVLNAKVSLSLASVLTYTVPDTELSVTSALVHDVFTFAASECYFYRTERQNPYCQLLGNLCVLQHLRPQFPACALLELIQRSGRTTIANQINGWYSTLPFLSYGASAESVLDSTAIGMKMSFDEAAKSDTHDHLTLVLATYDYRGNLHGFQRLTTQLLYCAPPAQVGGTPSWLRFGVSTSMRYTCDLSALDATSLLLFELYLIDYSKAEGDDGRYVPVPVQNRNYEDAKGFTINVNTRSEDVADDVLTHRFFLYDFLSGTAVGETQPKVFRYADSMTLTIRAQTKSVDAIYPPLLSISYVDTQSLRNTSMRFHVTYASDTAKFWTTAMSLFIVALGFAACRVVLHTYTWQRRSTRNEELGAAMWHSIAHVLMCSASNFAFASFGILFVMTNYFFVFFKWQARVYVLLPEVNYDDVTHSAAKMDEYYPLRVLLPLAFALQIVAVLHRIYTQTQSHVFFVDWEVPRAKMMDVDSVKPQNAPISIWRTILVANEWTKLQVRRRTSLEATIVLLLLLLYGYDLRSAAVPIPHVQMQHLDEQQVPSESSTDATLSLNLCLRFANVSCLWIALCIAQRLWNWLVYERYVDEPREMLFIDLCTVAKVSCLILDEPYHGFYLHCRSPYPFADGNMGELVDQLRQEEAGLTVGRGLDSSLPDCQAFEIFVTRKWKRKFQNLFSVMQNGGSGGPAGARKSPNDGLLSRHKHRPFAQQQSIWHHQHRQITQGMVKSAMQLSDFLKAFIENQDEQYRWRIYRAQTWLGHFFGIPPEVTSSKQSLFLPGEIHCDKNASHC